MIVTRKPCDDAFDRESESFRKAAQRLLEAATTCVRQAGRDLRFVDLCTVLSRDASEQLLKSLG